MKDEGKAFKNVKLLKYFFHPSSLYFQSVVSELDAVRQFVTVAGVFDIVCDVRQVRAARLDLVDVIKGAIKPEMRRVLAEAQAIEREHVQAAQAVNRFGWNLVQVCRIGEVVEAISDDGQASVYDFERRDL